MEPGQMGGEAILLGPTPLEGEGDITGSGVLLKERGI